MRHAAPSLSLLALLLAATPAPAQHGTLGPVEGSKQFLAARGIVVAPIPRDRGPEPRGRGRRRVRGV